MSTIETQAGTDQNPISQSIAWLVECGYTKEQAENLCRAVYSEKSGEHLWEIAPQWIEHVGEAKRYMDTMIDLVAMGLVAVTQGDDGEWLFQLNDKGVEAGKQLGQA